jgi:hypothetical protein
MKNRSKTDKGDDGIVLYCRVRDPKKATAIKRVYETAGLSQQAFVDIISSATIGDRDPVVTAWMRKIQEAVKKVAPSFNSPDHQSGGGMQLAA